VKSAITAFENIADLPRGSRMKIHNSLGTLLFIRRHKQGVWELRLSADSPHCRCCKDSGELLEDLEHFFKTDGLPQQRGIRLFL
jgi:hypothetical protein